MLKVFPPLRSDTIELGAVGFRNRDPGHRGGKGRPGASEEITPPARELYQNSSTFCNRAAFRRLLLRMTVHHTLR